MFQVGEIVSVYDEGSPLNGKRARVIGVNPGRSTRLYTVSWVPDGRPDGDAVIIEQRLKAVEEHELLQQGREKLRQQRVPKLEVAWRAALEDATRAFGQLAKHIDLTVPKVDPLVSNACLTVYCHPFSRRSWIARRYLVTPSGVRLSDDGSFLVPTKWKEEDGQIVPSWFEQVSDLAVAYALAEEAESAWVVTFAELQRQEVRATQQLATALEITMVQAKA